MEIRLVENLTVSTSSFNLLCFPNLQFLNSSKTSLRIQNFNPTCETDVVKHAKAVRTELGNILDTYDNAPTRLNEGMFTLGPRFFTMIPPTMKKLMEQDCAVLCSYNCQTCLNFYSWYTKNLNRAFPTSEVKKSPTSWSSSWVEDAHGQYAAIWEKPGIYDAIMLPLSDAPRDESLLAAALCFWNNATNTFDFGVGPMTPTLLDHTSGLWMLKQITKGRYEKRVP
ncbi:unnamed protein product [Prunus armeniaca]